MALNQITKIMLPNGQEVAFVDWSDLPLRSTADFLHGTTRQVTDLFQYVPGDEVPASFAAATATLRVSTEQDTNIATPGSMASTEEMLVYALLPNFKRQRVDAPGQGQPVDFGTAASVPGTGQPIPGITEVAALQQGLILQLEISKKVYADAPLAYFSAGFGPSGEGRGLATAAASGSSYGNPGRPSRDAVRTFAIPHHMGGQEKYRVRLMNFPSTPINFANSENNATPTDLLAVMQIGIIMDGLYKRPTS